jgi:hypothetical protein
MKGGLPPTASSSAKNSPARSRGFTIEEIEPRLFSFNAPQGACPACDGLGERLFDPQLVVPNEALSLKQGAIVPWAKSNPPSPYYMQVLASLAKALASTSTRPGGPARRSAADHPQRHRRQAGDPLTFQDGRKSYDGEERRSNGVIGNLNRRMLQTDSAWMREELSKFQTAQPCETCDGKRLKPEALAVKIAGEDISGPRACRCRTRWPGSSPRRPSSPPAAARSPRPSSRKSTSGWASSTMSGSTISTSTAPAARCRAGKPAHPPRQPDRLRAVGRALCARRAQHRPAPARQ